jgi:hypothetical protein
MSRRREGSEAKPRPRKRLQSSVVGLSLSFAGVACAEGDAANASPTATPAQARTVDLREEEIFDVTLGSFYVFDRDNPGGLGAGERVAASTTKRTTSGTAKTYSRACGGCGGCGGGCASRGSKH